MKKTFIQRADAIIALAKLHLAVKVPVRNPGILGVPKGKKMMELGIDHYKKLVRKKGWEPISKALMNQVLWNKNDDPDISKWAKSMQSNLAKWVKTERASDPSFGKD